MPNINVTDPGVVNVEDQAYPPIPPTVQGLPRPIEVFPSNIAQRNPAGGVANGLVPAFATVESQVFPAVSPRIGVSAVGLSALEVRPRDEVRLPVAEFIVTPNTGNFQTNNENSGRRTFKVVSVNVFDSGLPTERFQIFLSEGGVTANLFSFGYDLQEEVAIFASVSNTAREIINFNVTWILVSKYDPRGNAMATPSANQNIQIQDVRQGDDQTFQIFATPIEINPSSPNPPRALTLPASTFGANFQGNIRATDGVVTPFVGAGIRLPPFIGTFEVEDQPPSPPGSGLPVNVFK